MMKEDILENQDRRKSTEKSKEWVNAEIFPSLKFSKLCQMVRSTMGGGKKNR